MNRTGQPHDRHDRHLVAALAAGDLEPVLRADAEALVAACRECATLLADLRLIATATAALPLVPRTRDFRISPADAARLRPRGWRALLDAIGGARATFSRPLATTIPGALGGISFGSTAAAPAAPGAERNSVPTAAPAFAAGSPGGLDSATSLPPAAFGSAAPSAAPADKGNQPSPAATEGQPVAIATPAPGGPGPIPQGGTKGGGRTGTGSVEASGSTTDLTSTDDRLTGTTQTGGVPPITLVSIVLLVTGLGLFLARWGARRLGLR
jgi:hypothetical protein